MIIKKGTGQKKKCGGKKHLGKYFNCLLRFGASHKRSICAPQSGVKGETQMVLRTKQWKLIHELDKVKPIYLTILLLCACVWVCKSFSTCWCPVLYRRARVRVFDSANGTAVVKSQSPERTEFVAQPIKCAMNTSVCLSLQGSDTSMSLRLSFYESPWSGVRFLDMQLRRQRRAASLTVCATMHLSYDRGCGPFFCREENACQASKKSYMCG